MRTRMFIEIALLAAIVCAAQVFPREAPASNDHALEISVPTPIIIPQECLRCRVVQPEESISEIVTDEAGISPEIPEVQCVRCMTSTGMNATSLGLVRAAFENEDVLARIQRLRYVAGRLIEDAKAAVEADKFDEAKSFCLAVTALDPNNMDAVDLLEILFMIEKRLDDPQVVKMLKREFKWQFICGDLSHFRNNSVTEKSAEIPREIEPLNQGIDYTEPSSQK